MDKVEELQIEKVCRTCLCESDDLSSVFEEDEMAKIEFSQMLKLTFFLESVFVYLITIQYKFHENICSYFCRLFLPMSFLIKYVAIAKT